MLLLAPCGRSAAITSKKQKVLKCVAFLTGGEDRLNVNRKCEELAGSDKLFENTTLFLD